MAPLRIFVTTDNHIGSHENNNVRYKDASNTFEEIMGLAESQNVDLVLQCGDLFDKNKPSKMAWYSTIKTLREKCLGDKPVEFEVCNDNEFMLDDAEEFNYPNYEDQNINIALPVFAISGNHDDSGGGYNTPISPLDILGVSGLINHFGRVSNNTKIDVVPILIEKQGIKVALYGMANVRDERLYQTFKEGNVHFHRPQEDPDSWYNIMVWHQNNTARSSQKVSPENLIPKFFDLVIWGHEHECLIEPRLNAERGFYVMQPGSSVATSYHSSEAGEKYVATLTIDENKYMTCEKFMLKTVRPFVFRHIVLSEEAAHIDPTSKDARRHLMQWLTDQVDSMISEANERWKATHDADQAPMLPLIRLKVDYSYGYELENAVRFGNTFAGRVANPDEILHAARRRETERRWLPRITSAESEALVDENTSDINVSQVRILIKEYLEKENLQVLTEKDMNNAIDRFIEKDETNALKDEVSVLVQKRLNEMKLEEETSRGRDQNDVAENADTSNGITHVDDSDNEIVSSPEPIPSPPVQRNRSRVPPRSHNSGAKNIRKSASASRESTADVASAQVPPRPARSVRSTRAAPPPIQEPDHDNYDDEDDESVNMFSSDEEN